MFNYDISMRFTAIVYVAIYIYVSYLFVKDVVLNSDDNENEAVLNLIKA